MRAGGPRIALGSAIGGAVVMGVFEGVSALLHRSLANSNRPIAPSSKHRKPLPDDVFRCINVSVL